MTKTMIVYMVRCNIASDIWHTLEKVFVSQHKSKVIIMYYKLQLRPKEWWIEYDGVSCKDEIMCGYAHFNREFNLKKDQILYILARLGLNMK